MIFVAEGVSAAGKSTFAAQFAPALVEELRVSPPQEDNPRMVGRFWTDCHAERWLKALALESLHGMVCMGTDPLKIHYAWSLWQIGQGPQDVWLHAVESTREAMRQRRIGFADRIFFLDPPVQVVRAQKAADTKQRRSSFELHIRLVDPLRHWYQTLERLAPGRVTFAARHLKPLQSGESRGDRYDVALLDTFVAAVNRLSI